MDHKEAIRQLTELHKRSREYFVKHVQPIEESAKEEGRVAYDVPPKVKQGFDEIQREIRTFGAQLFADPQFFDLLVVWDVRVSGLQQVGEDVLARIRSADDVGAAFSMLGGMPAGVLRAIKDARFEVTSYEVMSRGWRVGMRCDESKSRMICAILHRRFRKAIDGGVISLERHFVDYAMPGRPGG